MTDRGRTGTNADMRHALAFSAVLAACGQTVVVAPPVVVKETPIDPDLDILFVIDNSASTADKQSEFAASFPAFMTALDTFPGGRPNVHIGVVNTTVDIGVSGFSSSSPPGGCPSPDPNDNGLLQQNTSCTAGPTDRYFVDVSDGSGGRVTNYTGDLATAFSCQAQIGDAGCGFEAPLFAIQRALDGTNPQNAGFLRPDADLAIVILTDEDDCSASDPSIFMLPASRLSDFSCQPLYAYDCDQPITEGSGSATYTNCKVRTNSYLADPDAIAQALATIKDPSQTAVALIAGPPETTIQTGDLDVGGVNSIHQDPALLPSCVRDLGSGSAMESCTGSGSDAQCTGTEDYEIGRPAIRLSAFASHYGSKASFHSVCQPDYEQTLTDIEGTMSMMLSPCLDSSVDPTDTDAAMPGLQLACNVADRLNAGTPQETQTAIPTCAMLADGTPDPSGAHPCWWAATDATCGAQGGSTLAMHVERAMPAPSGTVVRASCAGGFSNPQ